MAGTNFDRPEHRPVLFWRPPAEALPKEPSASQTHVRSPSGIVCCTPIRASRRLQNCRAGRLCSQFGHCEQKRCCAASHQFHGSAPCTARHSSCYAGGQLTIAASNNLLRANSRKASSDWALGFGQHYVFVRRRLWLRHRSAPTFGARRVPRWVTFRDAWGATFRQLPCKQVISAAVLGRLWGTSSTMSHVCSLPADRCAREGRRQNTQQILENPTRKYSLSR